MESKRAIKELDALTDADPENAHSTADDVLIDFIRSAGYPEVAEAYQRAEIRVGFW